MIINASEFKIAVEQFFVGNRAFTWDTERNFDKSTNSIINDNPLIGHWAIDLPEIFAATREAAANIVLRDIVTTESDTMPYARDAHLCRIHDDKYESDTELSGLRSDQEIPQGSSRERCFDNEALVFCQLFLNASQKLATCGNLLRHGIKVPKFFRDHVSAKVWAWPLGKKAGHERALPCPIGTGDDD
jgi:hypothetical protein